MTYYTFLWPITASVTGSRLGLPSPGRPQPRQPRAAASSAEQAQQYHETMQQLLQKQRQITRERQAGAKAAAAAALAAQSVTSPPPAPTTALALPAPPSQHHAEPPVTEVPPEVCQPWLAYHSTSQEPLRFDLPNSPTARVRDVGLLVAPSASTTKSQPFLISPRTGHPMVSSITSEGLHQPHHPQAHLQQQSGKQSPQQRPSTAQPMQGLQQPQLPQAHSRSASAPAQRQATRESPARRPLPDLLQSARGAPTKPKTAANAGSVGINLLSLSAHDRFVSSTSGFGRSVIAGSTRNAKASFEPASAVGRTAAPDFGPYFGGGKEGAKPSSASRPSSPPSAAVSSSGSQPPMAQRAPLSLNPYMSHAPPAGSPKHLAAGTPVAGTAAVAAGGMMLGGLDSAYANPNTAPTRASTTPSQGTVVAAAGDEKWGPGTATTAVAGPGTAAVTAAATVGESAGAAAKAKKKPARPAALWLSSFVQGAGRGGAPGGSAAAMSTSAPAGSAKPAVADAGAAVAAMVRAAAERQAVDLASYVSDMPATIPQLQARLEAAVQAEHESELKALRALYASGNLRQLQREGVVVVGLEAAETGRLYRSTLWSFSVVRKEGKGARGVSTAPPSLPYHKLRPGANVIITAHMAVSDDRHGGTAAGSIDTETGLPLDGVDGVVVEAHKDRLVVALEGRAHETFQGMVSMVTRRSLASPEGHGGGRLRGSRVAGSGASAGANSAGDFLGWRLDQSVRDTTTRRHLGGIRRLGTWTESSAEQRLGEVRVRTVLAGCRSASLLAAEAPEWVKEDQWRNDARSALAAQQGLNSSQRRAVAAALTRTVTLWQGPPGTGKTRTLLALVEILVRVRKAGQPTSTTTSIPRRLRGTARAATAALEETSSRTALMGPLLAVADTNAAVDNLVEGLAARGVVAVRLGPAAKARESLRHLSLEAQAEATSLGRKAVALRAQALRKQELWRGAPISRAFGPDAGAAVTAAAQAAEVRADIECAETALREASVAVVASADVVVATCTAAGDSLLDGRPWRCVVVDEASQATEPSVLVALTRGAAFVVMAGDPRQLPPTVLSEEALQHGLAVTLFDRVASDGGVVPMLLDTQYRMHPAISAFPSAFFYGGRLKDGVEAADKPVPQGFPWPNLAKPLALVEVASGREETSGGTVELTAVVAANRGSGGSGAKDSEKAAVTPQPRSSDRASYRNPKEALFTLEVTQRLLAAGDVRSVAILTPYRGQVRLIEALSRQRGLEARWAATGLEVAISTVDGYQGREADVVVFSAVRANERGAVGFLSDPRRMNVAITRPRRGLVVLANVGTLTRGSADWNTYIKWARMQGVVVSDEDVIDVDAAVSAAAGGAASSDTDDVPSSRAGLKTTPGQATRSNLAASPVRTQPSEDRAVFEAEATGMVLTVKASTRKKRAATPASTRKKRAATPASTIVTATATVGV